MNEKTSTLTADPPKDDVTIRCPRLGHQIHFTYCSAENSGLPCFKALDCWFHLFDVHTYLKSKMSETDFARVFVQTGKPKILSLFDLIQQAKERKGAAD